MPKSRLKGRAGREQLERYITDRSSSVRGRDMGHVVQAHYRRTLRFPNAAETRALLVGRGYSSVEVSAFLTGWNDG